MGKIISLQNLIKQRKTTLKDKIVVLATGVFDILHIEHVRFLKNAKKEGEVLVVGIESDKRVRELKGSRRPINPQTYREEVLAVVEVVDLVFILPKNLSQPRGREQFIKSLKPNIYAVSTNTPFQEEKKRIMELIGGEVKIVHIYNPNISTTQLIYAKMKKNG